MTHTENLRHYALKRLDHFLCIKNTPTGLGRHAQVMVSVILLVITVFGTPQDRLVMVSVILLVITVFGTPQNRLVMVSVIYLTGGNCVCSTSGQGVFNSFELNADHFLL